MPAFGERSLKVRGELHPDLVRVMDEAIKHVDFAMYCGHRSNEDQERLYKEGKSKARAGQSKHNLVPSMAVDLWSYPIDFDDTMQQAHVAGIVIGIAKMMGVPLRWGHDWDQDGDTRDNKFNDAPHFELI